jgi:hypothetical protein
LYLNYKSATLKKMNLTRIFGALPTVLGIVGLVYTAVIFANTGGGMRDIKSLLIYGTLGLLFFASGISLVRTTNE